MIPVQVEAQPVYMEVSVAPQMHECEKREGEGKTSRGGNGGQCLVFHRSTNESRDAQTGNSSIVLPPPCPPPFKSYTTTDALKHMYIQISHKNPYGVTTRVRLVCQTNTRAVDLAGRWNRLHLFLKRRFKLLQSAARLSSWRGFKELG